MEISPFTFSSALTPPREIPKPLVLVAGLTALAVTPWIESSPGRLLTQAAILSVGAVYFYHDRHHKRGGPFLSTEIKLPLWGKQGWYGTGRSLSFAAITDQHDAPIPVSATDVMLTVHFANIQSKRRCWLCDLIQRPPTLPGEFVMPKGLLDKSGDTFRFRYCGELVEATKSDQFASNLAKLPPPETTLEKSDRPASWTFLKGSLVSTNAETLRLEPGWQRYQINSDGSLTLHEEQILSDLFRSFDSASRWEMKAIRQELKVEEWPCYLMARRLTQLEEVEVLMHKNRLLIAISVATPSASVSRLTLEEDARLREDERNTPKYYYYDLEVDTSRQSFTFRIAGENLEVSKVDLPPFSGVHFPEDLT